MRIHRCVPLVVCVTTLLLAPSSSYAQAPSAEVTRYRLANGLEVLLAPEPGSPRINVEICYRGGAADEKPGQEGWAHLGEHLLLGGSRHLPKAEQNAVFSMIGGVRDGFTQFDHMGLWASAPANQLETLLWIRSDQLGFADPIDDARLAAEKEIVIAELRMRDRRPTTRARRRMLFCCFPSRIRTTAPSAATSTRFAAPRRRRSGSSWPSTSRSRARSSSSPAASPSTTPSSSSPSTSERSPAAMRGHFPCRHRRW